MPKAFKCMACGELYEGEPESRKTQSYTSMIKVTCNPVWAGMETPDLCKHCLASELRIIAHQLSPKHEAA